MNTHNEDIKESHENAEIRHWFIAIVLGALLALLVLIVSSSHDNSNHVKSAKSEDKHESPVVMLNQIKEREPRCTFSQKIDQCFVTKEELCDADIEVAKTRKFFLLCL